MKKIITPMLSFIMCLCLCSCGSTRVKGTRWENEWGSVEFSGEGVMTLKTGDSEEIFHYTDEKGNKDNCYVITYKTAEDMETGKDGVFIPYYIRDGELYFKGECYSESK